MKQTLALWRTIEIFAVQVFPEMCFPAILEWGDERVAHTSVLPDAALAEVAVQCC